MGAPINFEPQPGVYFTTSVAPNGTGGYIAAAPGSAATQVTPAITNQTANGSYTVAAGSRSVTFDFSGDFTGTVLGASYPGATYISKTIVAPPGCTLGAIAYTKTAGAYVYITDIR